METVTRSISQLTKNRSKSSIIRDGQKWFEYNYISRNNYNVVSANRFTPGYIYNFFYDPELKNAKFSNGKDVLQFYDTAPIVFCLGYLNTSFGERMIGLNISYFPPKFRIKFLDKIISKFDSKLSVNDKNLRERKPYYDIGVNYDIIKILMKDSGFQFTVRSYIPSRIKNKPLVIPPSKWYYISLFASKFIVKMNIRAIYILYKQNIDSSFRIGKKDPKISF